MGSGGSQTHALYATAPTATTAHETETSELGLEADQLVELINEQLSGATDQGNLSEELSESETEHLETFHQLVAEIDALQEGPEENGELAWYAQLKHASNLADHHLINAVAEGFPSDQGEQLNGLKAKATAEALAGLPEDQLHKIAKNQGFLYPELVGLNHTPGTNHALVHWLDPHYLPDLDSKAKIQAKAQERFTQLCAGQTIAGKTLADVDHSGYGTGSWSVSQEQYTAMCSTLKQQTEAFPSVPASERAQALAQLVDGENKVFTATIDGIDTASLSGSKAEATVKVDEALATVSPYSADCKMAVQTAQSQGHVTAEQAQVLSGMATLRLARASVAQAEKNEITTVANQRIAQVADAKSWHDTLLAPGGLVTFTDEGKMIMPSAEDGKAQAGDVVLMAQTAQKYFEAKKDVSTWMMQASDTNGLFTQISGADAHGTPLAPDELTKKFKTWAVGQDKTTLLNAAEALGMEEAASATKPQAKSYITGIWGKGEGVGLMPSDLDTPPAPSPQKKTEPTPSHTPSAASTKASAASAAGTTSFSGHHAKLLDALKHYSGVALDVPKPVDAKIVADHDFGSGTSATNLGGVHSKSLHTGPDGGQWLFKPDKKTGGARAAAEAAASQLFQAGGVSAVPVYTATIGSHAGAVQPMVNGASALASDPKAWTQADVDQVVRSHVAQWVMGDHDGHPGNILKTPSGGLVPIDAGQAFKYYGTDKLSLDYHPNADFGSPRPAYQQAYQAAAKGGLAPGVKIKPTVAHPVIKKLESIPDSQFRAMLHTTAHRGAKDPQIGWVPHMRKRAATKHEIPASKVSSDQIAGAFLDHACERKNTLRQSFSSFFSTELKLPGADALKYGG